MRILLLMLGLSLFCISNAHSADFSDCNVNEVVMAGDHNGHALLSCYIDNNPCTANQWIGFDRSTIAGKDAYMTLLLAFAKDLKVSGLIDHTTCSPYQTNVANLLHLRITK